MRSYMIFATLLAVVLGQESDDISAGKSYISSLRSCQSGYVFNAKVNLCVDQSIRFETTTVIPTTTRPPTIVPPTPVPTTPEPITTTTKTVIVRSGEIETSSLVFICLGPGSCPDPLSKESFNYCISDGKNGYIPIKIECAQGTEYIPELGTCHIPGEVGSTTLNHASEGTTVEPEPFVCPGPGLFPNSLDKKKFYYCLSDGDGGYISIELSCGAGTEFIPEIDGCGIPEEPETTTAEPPETTTEPSIGFVCPGAGKFPNPENKNTFYFCFSDNEGGYIPILMECGGGTEFDPELGECVEPLSTTTEMPTSPTTPGPFKCTDEGIFGHPVDQTKYYYCLPDGNGGYREVLHTCPLGLVYDPVKKYCSIPDKPFLTTTPNPIASTTPASFICTRSGKFPNPKDVNSYFVCIFDGFGYISIVRQCSGGLVFIPDLYKCAVSDTVVPPSVPVKCNSVGYLPDPNSCRDYYYCYFTSDGSYLTTKLTCPEATNFYANMEICVSDLLLKCDIDFTERSKPIMVSTI